MAKITIAGDAVVVTSAMKLEDIKTIEKYRPDALLLKDENGEPIFRVGTCEGGGSVGEYGVEFGAETHDDDKLAAVTFLCEAGDMDIKEFVADKIGASVLTLDRLEATLPAVLEAVKAEREQILANITVA